MKIEAMQPFAPAPATDSAQLHDTVNAFEAMMLKEVLQTAIPGSGDARHGLALQAVAAELAPAISFGLAQLLESAQVSDKALASDKEPAPEKAAMPEQPA